MKRRMGNRGSTLIEVIVCVLIIGIAFVPLMAGLSTSLRINRETENRLYAENVASNIVEICKTYGQQGFKDLKDLNADSSNGIKAFLAGDNVELVQLTDNTFKIKKISSGAEGKYYWANVTYSYDPNNQNDFTGYPPIAGLTNAAVITYNADDLNRVIDKLVLNNDVDQIKNNKNPDATEQLLKENVNTWLKRQITLDIKEITIEGKTRYVVDNRIEYIVNGSATVGAENKSIFKNSLIGKVVYESQPNERVTVYDASGNKIGGKDYDEVKEPQSYNALPQSVIVSFSELKNESGVYLDLPAPAADNHMVINKSVEGNIKIYAMFTDVSTLTAAGHSPFYMHAEGTATGTYPDYQISSYCNINPLDDDPDPANVGKKIARAIYYPQSFGLKEFGEGLSGKQSKMKDVSVAVYEYNGAEEGTEKVVEKTSTVIEFE